MGRGGSSLVAGVGSLAGGAPAAGVNSGGLRRRDGSSLSGSAACSDISDGLRMILLRNLFESQRSFSQL